MDLEQLLDALRGCRGVAGVNPQGDVILVWVRGRVVFVDRGRLNSHAITVICPVRTLDQQADVERALAEAANSRWASALLVDRGQGGDLLMVQAQLILPTPDPNDPMNKLAQLCTPRSLCLVLQAVVDLANRLATPVGPEGA
jgi:hypothetical protein